MNNAPVADQEERDRLRRDFDRTLFVEAGAGTGKTTAVVSRIVARVAAGLLRMERLVAITFTIAAAGELRVRVREGLEQAAGTAQTDEERAHLRQAASEVDRARIETIHAFCSALLRMHPLEAGLPPDLETLAELAADIDVRERFRRWFDSLRPGDTGAEAVRRGLLLGMRPERLLQLFAALNNNWDIVEGAHWPVQPVPAVSQAHLLGDEVQRCVDLLPYCHSRDQLYQRIDALRVVATRLTEAADPDAALAALVALERAPAMGRSGNQGNWNVVGGANACKTIKDTMGHASAEAQRVLTAARTAALNGIARELRDQVVDYTEERRVRGLVSYQDLLVRARNLIRDHADVRAALQARWDFVAVDEFQDTDPLQAELAFRLCAAVEDPQRAWHELALDPGRMCVVGDPKQSIYRFRRADIALYAAAERNVVEADPRAQVRLSVNFRSGRRIIDAVNGVFGGDVGLMRGNGASSGVQAKYVDLIAHDPQLDGSVSIFGNAVDGPASVMWRREAQATAAVVQRILGEKWLVDEGRGGPRHSTPNDVCILMPSRTNLRNLERELEAARIRYRLESGSLIIATQEVRDLLNILRSIDDSTDQVALVAALRTPAYGCSDVELVRWKAAGGRWSYERPGEGDEARVVAALADLRDLHALRHRMSVPGLIEEVLSRRLLREAAFDDWRPRETRRRYRFVAEQARALARSGRTTLHDAVDYLERLARDPSYDSVAEEESVDEPSVRVMTVHAAKGLEFPIVVVTGLGRKPQPIRPVIVTDHITGNVELRLAAGVATAGWAALDAREQAMEAAERVRLLYVALTRARDHLVVGLFRATNKGDETDAGRLDTLLRGRGDVAVLEVVWQADDGPRPPGEPDRATPDEQRSAEQAWVARRAELLSTLGALRTKSATGLAHAEDEAGIPPETGEDIAASRRGRAATSLGRAVHAVLQVIDLATGEGLNDLARAQAATEGIPERATEVSALVRAALDSEPVRRAANLRHWREVPLGAAVGGVLVEGFVDLLYESRDGRLVVVDYKTDAVRGAGIDARMAQYRLQGGVYALLVAEVTRRAVERIEFVFAAAGQTRTIAEVGAAMDEVRTLLASGPSGNS